MVALTLLVGLLYLRGVFVVWSRAGRGRGLQFWEVGCFAFAMMALLVATAPSLDNLTDLLFSAHMAQHVVLATIVPPLLVLGHAELAVAWAIPTAARLRVSRLVTSSGAIRAGWNVLVTPLVATLLHGLAVWMWHLPRLYELALQSEAVHAAEHLSFIATGALLWWRIIHPAGARRTGYARGILVLFLTATHTGALGALFTLSHRVWYPLQAARTAPYGLSALEDQQLAGLIMWVVGGLIYVAQTSALFVAWVRATSARHQRLRSVAAATVATISLVACGSDTGAKHTLSPAVLLAEGMALNELPFNADEVKKGQQAIATYGCGSCHRIDGIPNATGRVGPTLNGIGRRTMIAGVLPNTVENMASWLIDPQRFHPASAMPNLGINQQVAASMTAYLATLQ